MKAPLFLFQKRYHDQKCCTNRLSDKQKHGVAFRIIPLFSECAGLAVPKSTFLMPFSKYITYQGPQYLILKRKGVGLCWVKGI